MSAPLSNNSASDASPGSKPSFSLSKGLEIRRTGDSSPSVDGDALIDLLSTGDNLLLVGVERISPLEMVLG